VTEAEVEESESDMERDGEDVVGIEDKEDWKPPSVSTVVAAG